MDEKPTANEKELRTRLTTVSVYLMVSEDFRFATTSGVSPDEWCSSMGLETVDGEIYD